MEVIASVPHEPGFTRRALLRVSLVEMWERYSFYNMFALLALFLAAPVARGGMGWSDPHALKFFGTYLLVVTAAPIVGGYAIERWIGGRAALLFGAAALGVGHALLALAAILIARAPFAPTTGAATAALYAAVAFVAIGNSFYKPVLTTVVSRLPHADVGARERAFTSFFTFANVGGLISSLLGGWLAQRYGWGWAFGAAATGMAASLGGVALIGGRYIFPFLLGAGTRADRDIGSEIPERWPFAALGLLVAILIVTTIASFQSYGFINLFTASLVDRNIAGIVVPPSWFIALNPITIMAFSPVLIGLWRRGGLGHDWSPTGKLTGGFVLMAVAFGLLAAAVARAHANGRAEALWLIAVIVIMAFTELLTAPMSMSTFTRLAPRGRQTFALGTYGVAVGVGGWLSGRVGAFASSGDTVGVLTAIALVSAGCGVLLILLRRPLARLTI